MQLFFKYLICHTEKSQYYASFFSILKWHLGFLFLFCFTNTYSQGIAIDTAGNAYSKALSASYQSGNDLFLSRLKAGTTDRKLLKYYESNYKEIFKTVKEHIRDGQMMNIPVISSALEQIIQEIKTKNPEVPKDIQVLVLREEQPNAYTLGDNYLLVTLGLFRYLENEDQIASVLSHEIGHILMAHTLKALASNYERDKESAADIKMIRQVQMKKTDRAFTLLKSLIYKGGKIKRIYEMQADSAGYMLFKNTRYRKNAFIDALKIIDRYDSLRPDGLLRKTYKRFFDLPGQQFDDKWLKMEDFSSYNYGAFTEKFDKDSVSSHPRTEERIQHLKALFPELTRPENTGLSDTFSELKLAAVTHHIPNLFFNEQYGAVIFFSLRHLQEDPDNMFYKGWLGKGFQKIFEARKNYQLNRYLDRISPKDQTDSYRQFLSFMWNLKPEEIKNIAEFYSAQE